MVTSSKNIYQCWEKNIRSNTVSEQHPELRKVNEVNLHRLRMGFSPVYKRKHQVGKNWKDWW